MITIKLKDDKALLLACVISEWISDGDYRCTNNSDDIKFLDYLSDTILSVSVDSDSEYVVYKDL